MTEVENKETPKRKRRSKAEMEAARAAGETRTTNPSSEDKKSEDKEEKDILPVPKKEQSVLIMSCLHPVVAQAAIKSAKENGLEVVILEDKVLTDYLDSKDQVANKNNLSNFLNDTSNRLQCERNAASLWSILTANAPIELSSERIFSRSELCKKTKLSHSKAENALNALQIFGMLEYTKGNYEFRLVFDKKDCHKAIKKDVSDICRVLNNDILRYQASIEADFEISNEEKKKLYNDLQDTVNLIIEF